MQIGFRSRGRLRTFRWARIAVAMVVVLLGTRSLALADRHGQKPGQANSHGRSHGKSHGRGHGSLSISKQSWGTAHGQAVDLYTLSNSNGMKVNITNYGGVVQSIWVPD